MADSKPEGSESAAWTRLAIAIAVVGVALRSVQYFANAPLWLDEAALARNLVDRSFTGLAHPLSYGQLAPLGFLWIERSAILLFGPTERVFRLFPFVSGLVALLVFARLARSLLSSPGNVVALWLFALAVPLVFSATELRPYSTDVAATIIIAVVVHRGVRQGVTMRHAVMVGALGLLAWLSNVVILVLAGAGATFVLFHRVRPRLPFRGLIVVGGLWCVTALPALIVARHAVDPRTARYLQHRWADAFVPLQPGAAARWGWHMVSAIVGGAATGPLNGGLSYGWPWSILVLVIAALGFLALARRRPAAVVVLTAAAVATLGASLVRAYPFAERFVIFLLPLLLLAVGAGVNECGRLVNSTRAAFAIGAAMMVLSAIPIIETAPPQRREDITPVLRYITRQPVPPRSVYVYYGAAQAFLFYAPRFGFSGDSFVLGRCARGRPGLLLDDLNTLRGQNRVWILISHVLAPDEEWLMLRHLDAVGHRLDTVSGVGTGVSRAYLYDLSDTSRSATGETSALSPDLERPADVWQCDGLFREL